MNRIPLLAIAAVLVLASLTACAAPARKLAVLPTGVAAAHGTFNEAATYQFSWHIVGKSKYFDGATNTCDVSLPISIEDHAALASSNTNLPVYGAVFRDGQISYGTVWPTAVPGTGIVSGTGHYSISYNSKGLPVSAVGTATVVWHDPKKTPSTSKRTDHILLTFTHKSRAAGHC